MARTRGQNNIAKPVQKFSPSSNNNASKKTKADPPAPPAAAQSSTSDTKSKRKGKSKKTKEVVSAQAEAEPQDVPQEEQDAAGGGLVVSAIRNEREPPESPPKKAESTKAQGKRQKVDAELEGPAEAHPTEVAGRGGEASSSVKPAADQEDNEPASSGSKAKGKAKVSSKAPRGPAKPRKGVTKTPKNTKAEVEKDGAQEGDIGAELSGSKHEANPNNASKGPGKATKSRNRADDPEAGDKDDDPKPSAAKAGEAAAKPKSASKSAAKSTRTKKKANQPSSAAKKSIVDEKDNEAGPSAPKGKSDSESASQTSPTKTKPSKKVTKPKAAGSKAAQNATEEEDGEPGPSAATTRNESKAAKEKSTGAGNSKVKRSKKSANKNGTEAPPDSTSKTAITKGRKKRKISQVDDTQHEAARDSEQPQDEPRDDSNRNVRKPRKQATKSEATGSKRSTDKSNSKKRTPNEIPEPTTAGNRRKRKRSSVGDTNDETASGQGHQDEAPDDSNRNVKWPRKQATASKTTVSKRSADDRNSKKPSPNEIPEPIIAGNTRKRKRSSVGDTDDETGRGQARKDGTPDNSYKNVEKPRKQATASRTTRSTRSANKSSSKKPSPKKIPEATTAGSTRKRKRTSADTNYETDPEQGHQDEAPDDGNSRPKRTRQRVAAPKSAAKKVVENSRALARTKTPDDVDDQVGAKRKRGRGRPPKKSGKPDPDPNSGEGSSAAAKGRGKGRRKPADTTYRHRGEDEDEDEARLSGDPEDDGEEKDGPRKRRRVQDPTYRPDADAWSEPSPVSEHRAGVHPVRDRKSKEKNRITFGSGLDEAGYVENLLPPSERALNRSPDYDKRGKLTWHPSSRKKREGPGGRRGKVTKAAQAKTAQAEFGDNDDPADATKRVSSSAPEDDRRQDADGSQTSGSQEGEAEHRSDRIARLRASRLDGQGTRSSAGPGSQADTTPQPSKRDEPVSQAVPPRRPGDRHYRSQAGPAPQPSGVRGVSGLSIPSVQPNTLKRPGKTVVELKKEERQRKWDAERRRTRSLDSTAEETPSQQHPAVSFEDPAPGSQEDEAPQRSAHTRRHPAAFFASLTDPRRTRSWPTIEDPASRRVPNETDNPPSPGSARGKLNSEPEMSLNRMMEVAIPAMAIRDEAWSEVLRASSSGGSGTADWSSDAISSPTSSTAPPRPKKDTFMDATIRTAYSMYYRLRGIPWRSTIKEWRQEWAKDRAAEKRREREKARKAAAGVESGNRKGKGRVTKSTRSKAPNAAQKGKGKQKETTPEAEAPEGVGWEEEEEEYEEHEEEEAEAPTGQEFEERTSGSMNSRKDSHQNILTITQTTTKVKTPERSSRSAPNSISPQTRQAASILGGLVVERSTAEVGNNPPRQTTPVRQHGGQDETGPSPRTMLIAQQMMDFRQSGREGLQARDDDDDDDGGGVSGRESPLLGSDFDARSEGRSAQGEAEDEGGGLTEDQGTTEDEGREVQTPREEDEDEGYFLGGGMFRMAQRLIGKKSSG